MLRWLGLPLLLATQQATTLVQSAPEGFRRDGAESVFTEGEQADLRLITGVDQVCSGAEKKNESPGGNQSNRFVGEAMKISFKTVRIIISSSLVLMGLVFAFINAGPSIWFAAGMAFSWLGDMTNCQVKPICRWTKNRFVGGMAAFAAAHVFYLIGIFSGAAKAGINNSAAITAAAVIWGATMLLAGLFALRGSKEPISIKSACIVYITMVCVIAATGIGMTVYSARLWPLALGGMLFLASDLVVGLREIGKKILPLFEAIVWGTYAPAQFFLLLGAFLILQNYYY